jgi:hypothetical protein
VGFIDYIHHTNFNFMVNFNIPYLVNSFNTVNSKAIVNIQATAFINVVIMAIDFEQGTNILDKELDFSCCYYYIGYYYCNLS